MFNIDFRQIAYNLTPWFLRELRSLAFIYSLIKPLKDLNVIFNSYRTNTLYNLQFTSQTIYLEHYLNDQFDPINRAIFITTIDLVTITFIGRYFEPIYNIIEYNNIEGQLNPFVYNNAEQSALPNFIVNVPAALSFNSDEMKEKINFYNQSGKTYLITTF
jgi:hypothetical protein